jgi:alpha-D-ribose 1-methylphosphonate 5-triphosphate synthase subunit PhnI
MYVAVKGGAAAIEHSLQLVAAQRRGDPGLPALSVAQIRERQLLAVDRVMTEGSLYDPQLAALAIPHNAAAAGVQRAPGHCADASDTTYLGGIQGRSRRPVAGTDL